MGNALAARAVHEAKDSRGVFSNAYMLHLSPRAIGSESDELAEVHDDRSKGESEKARRSDSGPPADDEQAPAGFSRACAHDRILRLALVRPLQL